MGQLRLDFEPGLTERYPRWEDTFTTAVYSSRKGLNGVAADCDQSPSELSKRLAWKKGESGEPRPLRSCDVTDILDSIRDFTPIYWLIERYLKDPDAKRDEAIAELSTLMPKLRALIEASGPQSKGRAK